MNGLYIIIRYFLELEYEGSLFSGFQRQKNASNTIQQTIEDAIKKLCQQHATVVCAGRTDAGVHAFGQVIHVDLEKLWDPNRLQGGLNFYLSKSHIVVKKAYLCDLHARFDAKERFYEYRILNRQASSPLFENRVYHVPQLLNLERMQEGCGRLIGYHNFNAFRSSECQAPNPHRHLNKATCTRLDATHHLGDDMISVRFSAPAFLHNQVRIMVGTLVRIGLGKMSVDQIDRAFDTGQRSLAGPTAPPYGLYFMGVRYIHDSKAP